MLLQARTPGPCRATRGYWTGGTRISSPVTAAADAEMLPPVSPAARGDNQQSCFIRELINPCRSSLVTMIKFAEAEELPPGAAPLPVGMAGMALLHRRSRQRWDREALPENRTRPLHLHAPSPLSCLLSTCSSLLRLRRSRFDTRGRAGECRTRSTKSSGDTGPAPRGAPWCNADHRPSASRTCQQDYPVRTSHSSLPHSER